MVKIKQASGEVLTTTQTAYVVDDLVASTVLWIILSTYICVANSTGNAPSSSGTAHASWNYSSMAKGVADPIPSQSGNAGKILETNGSTRYLGGHTFRYSFTDQWKNYY